MKKILTSLSSVFFVLLLIAIAANTHIFQGMIIVPLLVVVTVVLLTFVLEYFPPFKYKKLVTYTLITCAGIAVVLFLLKSKSEVMLDYSDEKFEVSDTIVSTTTQKFKITNNNGDMVSTSTLSARGETVSVYFIRCSSVDADFCFGNTAVPINDTPENVLMWYHLISTNDQLSFGIQSRVGNKWPYIVDIDFGERKYDRVDYDFFKNKIPELFFETIKVSQ